jgi:hypothetical protein
MSLNGGRNRLWGYEPTTPLSTKDKLQLTAIAVGLVSAIGFIFWIVI